MFRVQVSVLMQNFSKVKSDVKIEVIESDPLHLYFSTSNGLGSGKMETGEIHLTLDQLSGKYRQVWIEAPEDSINSQAATQADKAKITNSRSVIYQELM